MEDLNDPTNVDSVPAILTPGEFVLNKEASTMFKEQIEAMNKAGLKQRETENRNMGGSIPAYNEGGSLPTLPTAYNEGGLVSFLKEHEGYRDEAYQDQAGVWTIGYGRTTNTDGSKIKAGQTTKQGTEDKWLDKRASKDRSATEAYGKKHGYDWNDNQLDAMASFRYNIGNLDQLTDGGTRDMETIMAKIPEYNKAGGQTSEGLVNRRNAELALFQGNNNQQEGQSAPTQVASLATPPVQGDGVPAEVAVPPQGGELPGGFDLLKDWQPQHHGDVPPNAVPTDFGEAFASARAEQGEGGTFNYDGEEFNTNYANDGGPITLNEGGPTSADLYYQQTRPVLDRNKRTSSANVQNLPTPPRPKMGEYEQEDAYANVPAMIQAYRDRGEPVDWNAVNAVRSKITNQNVNNKNDAIRAFLDKNPEYGVPGGSQGAFQRNDGGGIPMLNDGGWWDTIKNTASGFFGGDDDDENRPVPQSANQVPRRGPNAVQPMMADIIQENAEAVVPGTDEALLQTSSGAAQQELSNVPPMQQPGPQGVGENNIFGTGNSFTNGAVPPPQAEAIPESADAFGPITPDVGTPVHSEEQAESILKNINATDAERKDAQAFNRNANRHRHANAAAGRVEEQAVAINAAQADGTVTQAQIDKYEKAKVTAEELKNKAVAKDDADAAIEAGTDAESVAEKKTATKLASYNTETGEYEKPVKPTTTEKATTVAEAVTSVTEEVANTESPIAGQGTNPNEGATTDEVTTTGTNASNEDKSKGLQAVKKAFGDLFDSDELVRMGIMFAGSILTGASPAQSLAFAGKGYLQRVDAKQAGHAKNVQEFAKGGKYSPASVENYKQSKNLDDLVPVATTNAFQPTGKTKDYLVNGKRVRATEQKDKETGAVVYVDGSGRRINQAAAKDYDPKFDPRTSEYQTHRRGITKDIESRLKETYDAQNFGFDGDGMKTDRGYTTIGPSAGASAFFSYAEELGMDPGSNEAQQLYTNAMEEAIAAGKANPKSPPGKLRPFLEAQHIRQTTKAADQFKLGPNRFVSPQKMQVLENNVNSFARLAGDRFTADQVWTAGLTDWTALSTADKKVWEKKVGKNGKESAYYQFMEDKLASLTSTL